MRSTSLAIVLLIVQVCYGAPADPVAKSDLETLATKAQGIVNDVTNSIMNAIPDSKQVTDVLTTQTHAFAENVQGIVGKLQDELKNNKGQVDTVIKQVSDKLSETLASLQKSAGPDATAKGQALQHKLDDGLKTTILEIEKLVKAVQPDMQSAQENVTRLTKGVLDDFVKAAQTIQENVKNSLQQAAANN